MQFKSLNQLLRTALLSGIVATGIVTIGSLALTPSAYAAEGDTPPGVQVSSGTGNSLVVVAGEETQISVSANITHDPVSNQECTLSGPDWDWSASGAATIESNDENATLTFTFDTAGDYTVGATATASYSSNCSGDVGISGSGGISFAVKVVAKTWATHTEIGKGVNSLGVVVDNGRMTAPQDQTKSPAVPVQIFIPVGKEIDVSVEAATDNDKWTLDLNGDGTIDPNPAHGETGVESDSVKYKWAGGGNFTDSTSAATKWSSSTPASYTLTCTIDDDHADGSSGVDSPEVGSRNDDATVRSVTVVVFSAKLFAKRQGTDSSKYGATATIAAGGKDNSNHKADIKIEVLPAISGIPIAFAADTSREGYPVGGGDGVINMAATTDTNGLIVGTYKSSNLVKAATLTLDLGLATNPSVSVSQVWNDTEHNGGRWDAEAGKGVWEYDDYSYYGIPSTVNVRPKYYDDALVNIDAHTLKLKIVSASVWVWDGSTWTSETYSGSSVDGKLYSTLDPTHVLGSFAPSSSVDTPTAGTYSAALTVEFNDFERVDSIIFDADAADTYQ